MTLPVRHEPATTSPTVPWLELLMGSNVFRNTNGVVKIQGKEQLFLESKPEQGLLLVTVDLYSDSGVHVGHLRRNTLMLNRDNQFAVSILRTDGTDPGAMPSVTVTDRFSGQTVLEAQAMSDHKIQITMAKLYSHKGNLIDITPHYCRIGAGPTLFGDVSEYKGASVVLG